MKYNHMKQIVTFLIGVFATSAVYTEFIGSQTGRPISFAGSGLLFNQYFNHTYLGLALTGSSTLLVFGYLYLDYKSKNGEE